MELDYYDYNVINAGAAPGSYLGMDPAYLVWIPPIDDEDAIETTDFCDADNTSNDGSDTEPHYEEISPEYRSARSSCTIETPVDDAPDLPPLNRHALQSNESLRNLHNAELSKIIAATSFNEDVDKMLNRNRRRSSSSSGGRLNSGNKSPIDAIPLKEFQSRASNRFSASPAKVHRPTRNRHSDDKDNDTEKETAVVKSPSDKISNYYQLDDIQFADEDDVDDDAHGTVAMHGQRDNKSSLIAQ